MQIKRRNSSLSALDMARILICEDDRLVASTLARLLSYAGYKVSTVNSALEALSDICGPNPPDALITDLALPSRMSGIDLANHVLEKEPFFPIIILTGWLLNEDEIRGKRTRDVNVMHKPVNLHVLLETLDEIFDERNSSAK